MTLDTSHEPIGSLKVERHGALFTSESMLVTTPVSQVEMWPCATSALAALPHHSTSASARLLLLANEVEAATMGSKKRTPSSLEQVAPMVLVGFEEGGGRRCCAIRVRSERLSVAAIGCALIIAVMAGDRAPRGMYTFVLEVCAPFVHRGPEVTR